MADLECWQSAKDQGSVDRTYYAASLGYLGRPETRTNDSDRNGSLQGTHPDGGIPRSRALRIRLGDGAAWSSAIVKIFVFTLELK